MLIINADDLGLNRLTTDRILAGHARGSVTSASAMVFMADSARAAVLANAAGLDTGLHLNFTEPFTGEVSVPRVAWRHEQIARFLSKHKFAQLFYHPGLRKQFEYVFQAQVDEFYRLYEHPPSHFDGHHHMHLCANMLLDGIIPPGEKIRRSFSFLPGQKSWINRAYRWCINRRIRLTHPTTDFLFSLAECLRCKNLGNVVALAKKASVELETHPEKSAELEWLLGDACAQVRASVPTGSYATL